MLNLVSGAELTMKTSENPDSLVVRAAEVTMRTCENQELNVQPIAEVSMRMLKTAKFIGCLTALPKI